LGIAAVASRIRRLSRISAPAGADGGGVTALADELDTTNYRLRGWVVAPMLTGLSSR
jgi:hypothetical protein